MHLNFAISQLQAAADPSRLRLLALLLSGEAAVTELVEVLQQSQPRISRHLRLLTEAGLVEHVREGRWVYYRLTSAARVSGLGQLVTALQAGTDPVLRDDRERLNGLRRQREREVLATRPALPLFGPVREADLAELLDAALGPGPLGAVLDVGAGSGALLRLLGGRAGSAIGIDPARPMRQLARSRLHAAGLSTCTVRDGDAHDLPFPSGAFEVVVLDEVLHQSHAPDRAIGEAVRVLGPAGRLLVYDRILPVDPREGTTGDVSPFVPASGEGRLRGTPVPERTLRQDVHPHPAPTSSGKETPPFSPLYDAPLTARLAAAGLRVIRRQWVPGRAPDRALFTAIPPGTAARTGTHD